MTITHDAIQTWLKSTYALTDATLTDLVSGDNTLTYRVAVANKAYTLKLKPRALYHNVLTVEWVKFLQALYYDFNLSQMTAPPQRAVNGQHLTTLEGFIAVLMPFIEGNTLDISTLNDNGFKQIGSLLASIHRCKLEKPPQAETFQTPINALWQSIVTTLDAPHTDDALAPTLALIMPYRHTLDALYTRFCEAQTALQSDEMLKKRFVLCHTAPTPEHLVQHGGQFHLLDWELPRFAPAECDLAHWHAYPLVLEGYQRMLAFTPDERVMQYYQDAKTLMWAIKLLYGMSASATPNLTALEAFLSQFEPDTEPTLGTESALSEETVRLVTLTDLAEDITQRIPTIDDTQPHA